jgi:RNA polymerase sigma-70 factor (ECF subfamily)
MSDDRRHDDLLSSAATRTADLESTVRLFARAQAGDRDALHQLLSRHLTPLRRWASGRLPKWARDVSDTDDLVQDTLLGTIRRLSDFELRSPGALQAYLREAILNRVRDALRRRSRRPETAPLDGVEVDPAVSPLEEAIGHEALERYEQALHSLTPADREAVIGRVEMGYSYDELAEALGKPSADAARKAAKRALLRLARRMSLPSA